MTYVTAQSFTLRILGLKIRKIVPVITGAPAFPSRSKAILAFLSSGVTNETKCSAEHFIARNYH
jgi:hypothetical protein